MIEEDRRLDLEEARQSLDMLEVQLPLPGQDLGDGRDRKTRSGRDVALRDRVSLDQEFQHLRTRSRRDGVMLVFIFLDEHGQRQQEFGLFRSAVTAPVTQTI